MTPDLLLHLVSRILHIGSVILLLGGVTYARLVLVPTLNALPEGLRAETAAASQRRFRSTLYTLLVLIVISGTYNFLSYSGPKHGRDYQIWFGIKMLLVLHILATSILWSTAPYGDIVVGGKGNRRTASIAIAGFVIVIISAYLRSLSQRGL